MTLIYVGTPRYFVGRVTIAGVKDERLASLLEYATKLQPGTEFTDADDCGGHGWGAAGAGEQRILPGDDYCRQTTVDDADSQVNATYTVNIGPQARVGAITLEGKDPGLTVDEVRKKGKLKQGSKVNRETVSNALTRLRSQYQKQDRLEATTSLRQQTYNQPRKQVDYDFNANQGPLVKVVVEGASLSKSRLKLLVPIYEEGTIDNDLLNEGTYNIKDFLFQQGYFDATVAVKVVGEGTPSESVVFSVDKGAKHKVGSVTIVGNHYFETDLLKERMQVQKADAYLRNGRYSPALMKADVDSILALYRANGFNNATITTSTKDIDTTKSGKKLKVAEIAVVVTVTEGPQQKFGTVTLTGVDEQPDEGCEGAAELAGGPALFADYALGRPGRDAWLLPEPRLCAGQGGGEAAAGERRCAEDGRGAECDGGRAGLCGPRAALGDRPYQAGGGGQAGGGACGRSAGPERAAGYAAQALRPGAVQRSERGGAESGRRRSAEECAAAIDRGAAVGCDLRIRIRGGDGHAAGGRDQSRRRRFCWGFRRMRRTRRTARPE